MFDKIKVDEFGIKLMKVKVLEQNSIKSAKDFSMNKLLNFSATHDPFHDRIPIPRVIGRHRHNRFLRPLLLIQDYITRIFFVEQEE